jgi:hypothetical protein
MASPSDGDAQWQLHESQRLYSPQPAVKPCTDSQRPLHGRPRCTERESIMSEAAYLYKAPFLVWCGPASHATQEPRARLESAEAMERWGSIWSLR